MTLNGQRHMQCWLTALSALRLPRMTIDHMHTGLGHWGVVHILALLATCCTLRRCTYRYRVDIIGTVEVFSTKMMIISDVFLFRSGCVSSCTNYIDICVLSWMPATPLSWTTFHCGVTRRRQSVAANIIDVLTAVQAWTHVFPSGRQCSEVRCRGRSNPSSLECYNRHNRRRYRRSSPPEHPCSVVDSSGSPSWSFKPESWGCRLSCHDQWWTSVTLSLSTCRANVAADSDALIALLCHCCCAALPFWWHSTYSLLYTLQFLLFELFCF